MARRGGKAANRKAKQRKTQRPAAPPRAVSANDRATPEDTFAAEPMRADTPAAPVAPAASRESARKTTRDPRSMLAGPSRLSERAQAEYHYVQRDLRNIGVLVVIMAAILAVAYIAFNVMGIARAG